MPLKAGNSKETVSTNIKEFHGGRTYTHTLKKFGKKRADKQSIAVALSTARKYAKKAEGGATVDPNDMTDKYNTRLSPKDEAAFQSWAAANPRLGNTYDYDSRGFWQSGAGTASNGHGGDQWKKPNHITFSNQSQYSGTDGYTGGNWNQRPDGSYSFIPSATNLNTNDANDLRDYFSKQEQGNDLVLPSQPQSRGGYAHKGEGGGDLEEQKQQAIGIHPVNPDAPPAPTPAPKAPPPPPPMSEADLTKAYLKNLTGTETGEAGTPFKKVMSGMAQGLVDWVKTPGKLMEGPTQVQPETPGEWSDLDEQKQQWANDAYAKEMTDFGAGTAVGQLGMARMPGMTPPGAIAAGGGNKYFGKYWHPYGLDPEEVKGATLVKTNKQTGGSNPGGIYQLSNGTPVYIKQFEGDNAIERTYNEVLANKLLELTGVPVPKVEMTQLKGKPAVASYMVPGKQLNEFSPQEYDNLKGLREHYPAHLWTGNYDFVGDKNNIMVMPDGQTVHIDSGGALRYRAQGKLKGPDMWGPEVNHFDFNQGPNGHNLGDVMGGHLQDPELQASAERVANVTDQQIHDLVQQYGPINKTEKPKLEATLKARRDGVAKLYKVGKESSEPWPSLEQEMAELLAAKKAPAQSAPPASPSLPQLPLTDAYGTSPEAKAKAIITHSHGDEQILTHNVNLQSQLYGSEYGKAVAKAVNEAAPPTWIPPPPAPFDLDAELAAISKQIEQEKKAAAAPPASPPLTDKFGVTPEVKANDILIVSKGNKKLIAKHIDTQSSLYGSNYGKAVAKAIEEAKKSPSKPVSPWEKHWSNKIPKENFGVPSSDFELTGILHNANSAAWNSFNKWHELLASKPNKLTAKMKSAVGYWGSQAGYKDINETARGNKPPEEKAVAAIENLDAAMKVSPLEENSSVWRGLYGPQAERLRGLKEGDVFFNRGYTATTVDPRQSTHYGSRDSIKYKHRGPDSNILVNYHLPAGQPSLYVSHPEAGNYIQAERELLLPHGDEYQIIGKETIRSPIWHYLGHLTDAKPREFTVYHVAPAPPGAGKAVQLDVGKSMPEYASWKAKSAKALEESQAKAEAKAKAKEIQDEKDYQESLLKGQNGPQWQPPAASPYGALPGAIDMNVRLIDFKNYKPKKDADPVPESLKQYRDKIIKAGGNPDAILLKGGKYNDYPAEMMDAATKPSSNTKAFFIGDQSSVATRYGSSILPYVAVPKGKVVELNFEDVLTDAGVINPGETAPAYSPQFIEMIKYVREKYHPEMMIAHNVYDWAQPMDKAATQYIVFNTNILRSPTAAFDPTKWHLRLPLAGIAGLGAGAGIYSYGDEKKDQKMARGGKVSPNAVLEVKRFKAGKIMIGAKEKAHRTVKKYAKGGKTPFEPKPHDFINFKKGGMIDSDIPGRSDHIPMKVSTGAYVLPADIPSALGQGNSKAGKTILDSMFTKGPYGLPLGKKGGKGTSGTKMSKIGFKDGGKIEAEEALPEDHKLGMAVPKGGSMCANCKYLASPTTCGNDGFVKWNGSDKLPNPANSYCCDLYEIRAMKKADGGPTEQNGNDDHVPIIAAGGEYIIHPETVAHLGNGNMDHGHKVLDKFVLHTRKQNIQTLKKLKPPK